MEKQHYEVLLDKLVAQYPYGAALIKGAELGVRHGDTSEHLLTNLPGLELILVDPYMPYLDLGYQFTVAEQYNIMIAAMKRLSPFSSRISWRIKTSLEASFEVQDKSLNFVFIDAEHTFKAAMLDILVWASKVMPGGLLCGHDYSMTPVKAAVTAYATATNSIVEHSSVHSDCWFIKV